MTAFSGSLILLDVEGTVSPLAFVHEVMFPFARERVGAFLEPQPWAASTAGALQQMAVDAGKSSFAAWCPHVASTPEAAKWVTDEVHRLMDADAKLTGLKQLQGLIWEAGFRSGELCATLFEDVAGELRRWHAAGLRLCIYSSGSVHAQKLFFAHTEAGDLTSLLSGYFDTTTGPKREAASYAAIAAATETNPGEILFLSDVVEELNAAREAGMQTALAIRPGNRETSDVQQHPVFHSLRDIITVRP